MFDFFEEIVELAYKQNPIITDIQVRKYIYHIDIKINKLNKKLDSLESKTFWESKDEPIPLSCYDSELAMEIDCIKHKINFLEKELNYIKLFLARLG